MKENLFIKPLSYIGIWEEPNTKTKRVTVVITLPPGVRKQDFAISVSKGGKQLELTVTWPDPMVNVELLHRKWLPNSEKRAQNQFTMFHPFVLSLEDALKKRRDRAQDAVKSKARVLLPFEVQTRIEGERNFFFTDSGAKIINVE